MKKLRHTYCYLLLAGFAMLASSCRKDAKPDTEQTETVFEGNIASAVKGFYLLNEGNLNMNKASLDYIDYTTGVYQKNVYSSANPEAGRGLGDVGNDMAIYGSKLFIVVNNSNKVEVLDARTRKRIKQIDIVNCRYITFKNNKAYVSAYVSAVGDANAGNGIVAEIDTTTLLIERRVTIGRQPEGIAIVGNKLYVANSGGYSPKNYERTISVVDLASFTEIKRIDVAINLNRMLADANGDLYVTSQGDYLNIKPKLFVIDTRTEQLKKTFELGVRTFCLDDKYLYTVNSNGQNFDYSIIDVDTETLLNRSFITDGTGAKLAQPYGIAVNPVTKEILLTDAGSYVNPGTLYCFDTAGRRKWSVTTGDIPAHFAFIF
ncbi:YncE family protein [Mucilaginibacter aquatilis]|uniref:YncE family protein n=1 Tax=Mucilaginibacter aquatilis TaxID=1517760 RepID=A0A6I4IQR6_9SPHI|nr:YncE family protein [Mucilaginibacter aquatilis]MVN91604.1 YncE family protein [Mucilaginibacter aquatilis]